MDAAPRYNDDGSIKKCPRGHETGVRRLKVVGRTIYWKCIICARVWGETTPDWGMGPP